MANISELDFDTIKANLKTYLKTQSEFTDFDFDGPAITVILDVLAYVTHYMGAYANMSHSEMFLDSAQLRSSVVSLSKAIGYTPRQRQAAQATINLQILNPAGSPASIVVDTGTQFVASIDGVTYNFVTVQDYSLTDQGGGDYNKDLTIVQGIIDTVRYTHDVNNPQKFVIDQKGIDSDYITVKVKNLPSDLDSTATVYTLNTDITTIDPTSTVFFIQENADGKVEIYFGDGVLGKAIEDGNEVVIEYLTTEGPDANLATGFSLTAGIGGYSIGDFTITTVSKAAGGALEESIESIKYISPKIYKAQGRAVTADDYRAILLDQYGWIETLNVWGGEDNVPQIFGKVFVSIKPDYGTTLTQPVKDQILAYLDKFRIVGISPEIVDPDYIYVNVNTSFTYNSETTALTQIEMEALVDAAISAFFTTTITASFDTTLNYSKLLAAIDASDHSIVGNETSLTISKRFVPNTLNFFTYTFDFANEIIPGTFMSNEFTNGIRVYQLKDDSNGNINLYMDGELVVTEQNKHTINYTTGAVTLLSWKADTTIGDVIELFAQTVNQNITATRNALIIQGTNTITSGVLV